MFTFTKEQMQHLAVLESHDYVDRVYNDMTKDHPERITDDLKERLYRAFDYAEQQGIGLEVEGAITQFLYWESSHPEFYKQPAMHAWLSKAGASADQRWADAMAIARHKQGIQDEKDEEDTQGEY